MLFQSNRLLFTLFGFVNENRWWTHRQRNNANFCVPWCWVLAYTIFNIIYEIMACVGLASFICSIGMRHTNHLFSFQSIWIINGKYWFAFFFSFLVEPLSLVCVTKRNKKTAKMVMLRVIALFVVCLCVMQIFKVFQLFCVKSKRCKWIWVNSRFAHTFIALHSLHWMEIEGIE